MLLVGCSPAGRHTEQHDVFFGIAEHIGDLIPDVIDFWPEAGKIHFDAWREVSKVDNYEVSVVPAESVNSTHRLFFINLGGYKRNEFEEFHYKMLVAAPDKGQAIQISKQTAFFRHTGFKGANAHVDDKYGVDVDDIHEIRDILPPAHKSKYALVLRPASPDAAEDEIHLGYFRIDNVHKWAPRV